jgi:hypothetical protein
METGEMPKYLRVVKMNVHKENYWKSVYPQMHPQMQFCAGGNQTGAGGTLSGDSG